MDLNKLPLLALATKRMGWLARRQEVLSQNVANADTPGYVPHDLKPQDFKAMLRPAEPKVQVVRTSAAHLEPVRRTQNERDRPDIERYETAPSGNAVVLEDQMMRVSETQTDYRMATTLYRKHIAMLKAAIGRNQ